MNAKTFVDSIKIVALRDAVAGTMEVLGHPPGRRPAAEIQELSKWFHGLSVDDRSAVEKVVTFAARQAVYNLLSVLDGIAAFEPSGPKGRLELYYVKDDHRTLLNPDEDEQLTSVFKDET
jgi:hypothetical protein